MVFATGGKTTGVKAPDSFTCGRQSARAPEILCRFYGRKKQNASAAGGKVRFISPGCPKALVDSGRILTQLRLDGYDVVPTYDDADIVVVNTCGFIDAAKQESLDVIGEAINENGKIIVTGCMGVEAEKIRDTHPGVLAGPAAENQNAVPVRSSG